MPQSRQLAAIMPACRNPDCYRDEGGFTDIVGYTALMGKDEHKAFVATPSKPTTCLRKCYGS